MTADDLLEQAIAAIKAGDREQGKQLILQILAVDDSNENAWLGMAVCVDNPKLKRGCLERALEINPNSELAKRGLRRLDALGKEDRSSLTARKRRSKKGHKKKVKERTRNLLAFICTAVICVCCALSFSRLNPGTTVSTSQISRPTRTHQPTSTPWPTKTLVQSSGVQVRCGAICKDGWRSNATGRGACSHHGGVARWVYCNSSESSHTLPTLELATVSIPTLVPTPTPLPAGSSIVIDNWQIRVERILTAKTLTSSYSDSIEKAGGRFALVFIVITNRGLSPRTFTAVGNLVVRDAGEKWYRENIMASFYAQDQYNTDIGADINPDETVHMVVVFDVSEQSGYYVLGPGLLADPYEPSVLLDIP